MSTDQVFVIIILFVGIAGILCFWRYFSERTAKMVLTSFLLVLYAVLLTNTIMTARMRELIEPLFGEDAENEVMGKIEVVRFAVFFFIATVLVLGGIIIQRKVTDEEKVRRIFFRVCLGIFIAAGIWYTIDAIIGIVEKKETVLPGHACRQACNSIPLVYFMREHRFRRWTLSYFCYSGIIGGIATLCVPGNVLLVDPIFIWLQFDTVISHMILTWIPVILFVNGHIKVNLRFIPIAIGYMGLQLLFAFLCNLVLLAQTGTLGGKYGNYMWLVHPVKEWLPTWIFLPICLVIGILIGVGIFFVDRYIREKSKKAAEGHTNV